MESSFLLAYLCDYEVGSGLNTDQASPRGKDVSSPGPGRHADTLPTKYLANSFMSRDSGQAAETSWVSGTYILSGFHVYNSGVCVLIESAFVLMR